ncbi:SulP family inorganic anion transporter [Pseudomonas sp.]|uniref:SulP family inorganic anion transporter n=1 Tax=Pseudomonas sp. TaxID=306 RepID=UPI003BB6762F
MFSRWPLLNTLRSYDRDQAGRDLLAACLVCLLLVPQALAYAQLAGLPAVVGLYASILPLVAYALIGASPGVALSFGPVAVLSLMTAAALAPVAVVGSAAYLVAATTLTLLVGVLIALVGFVESVSIAQSLAMRKRQSIKPDLELLGQGAANIAAACSGGMPVAASFSRSALAVQGSVATPLAGVLAACLMLAAVLMLAPLLQHLPQAVLAASIIVAVMGLIDLSSLRRTWRYSREEGAAQLATVLGVLLYGVEAGILLGVGLSLLLFLWRTSRPHMAVVGQVPGSEHFRNVERYQVVESPSVLSLRVDESLYFPNVRYLEERIAALIAQRPGVRHLVLMCSGVNQIDASAVDTLEAISERLHSAGVQLHLAEVKGPVMDRLRRSEFIQRFAGQVFISQYQALQALDPASVARAARPL